MYTLSPLTQVSECINYHSIAPERFKTGVIKTMLNRSYKICSDVESFNMEIDRLHKLFTNNNFPNKLIIREIDKFRRGINRTPDNINQDNITPPNEVQLFYRSQMSSAHKQEEGNLKRIIDNNVSRTAGNKVSLMIYYKNR